MADGGNVSDESITEALIMMVVVKDLDDRPLQDVPFFTPNAVEVQNEEETGVAKELFTVIQQIGDQVKDNKEIEDGIQRFAQKLKQGGVKGANKTFIAVMTQMIQGGITWKNIAILLYVVGKVVCILACTMAGIMVYRMTDRMVTALCPLVMAILNWTFDFFKKYLLGWIREQGGWIRCLFL